MRSNLLSLQNISGQVSSTQNKLSTGNKVNSAIDNPSSYYTALSLNNRADDLNALLDSMGQAVSTIKAATTALESATEFLEQASAVATQALETAKIPSKSFFEEKVGENGAVVTTAQELKDAIAAGKETICVYGTINYFENESIQLQEGQQLVGTEYFTGYTGTEKFSQLNFDNTGDISCNGIVMASDSLVSDLFISKTDNNKGSSAILIQRADNVIVNNVDIYTLNNNNFENSSYSAIKLSASTAKLTGNINIRQERTENPDKPFADFFTISLTDNSLCDIEATLNIKTDGHYSWIFSMGPHSAAQKDSSTINIKSGSIINAQTDAYAGFATTGTSKNMLNIENGSIINTNKNLKDNLRYNKEAEAIINYNPDFQLADDFIFNVEEKDNNSQIQYQEIINQYDSLIKDASYKGVNLLQNDKLSVKFNENNTADLSVQGKDMSSQALGFKTFDWQTQADIADSLAEIASALKSIRNYSAELGNNYSIITTRQDFTESLVNVLTEGADKLTLADMNEESANMLALQTRQQLAINSLSLASQASQSILKLF